MGFEIFYNLGIGLFMIVTTFLFHAYALDRLIWAMSPLLNHIKNPSRHIRHLSHVLILLITSLGVICILSVQIWAWAFLYLYLDLSSVHNLETALYFSMITFTTVGYGDIILDPYVRLLSGMQATSGMLLFGWSAAFIFEILSTVYHHRHIRHIVSGEK